MNAGRTPAPAPRWPTLLALTATVAGVHLALLLGPVSWSSAAALAPVPSTAFTKRRVSVAIPDRCWTKLSAVWWKEG